MRRICRLLLMVTVAGLWGLGSWGCQEREAPLVVRLEERHPLPLQGRQKSSEGLAIGIGSMITPRDGYAYYRQLLSYLGARVGIPVKAVDPGNYQETNELLASGALDAAFVCGGPYVEGHEEFGLELLAMPLVGAAPVYYSYLIVPVGSAVRNYADLRGKTFAFTDPRSNSGALVPTFVLTGMGEDPETFFSRTLFTYAHDASIQAVAEGLVDGAAVDSLIWDYLQTTRPELTAKTRVVWRSEPFGIPPVVAGAGLDPLLKENLRQALFGAHRDPEGRHILQGMMIERFVPGDDAAYESIRRMRRQLAEAGR